jgi:hypothetical protein
LTLLLPEQDEAGHSAKILQQCNTSVCDGIRDVIRSEMRNSVTRPFAGLVSNDLSLETSCTVFCSCERWDDHGLSNTAERCSSGTANAGEVVAIGSSDPLDYAEVAEPAKLA